MPTDNKQLQLHHHVVAIALRLINCCRALMIPPPLAEYQDPYTKSYLVVRRWVTQPTGWSSVKSPLQSPLQLIHLPPQLAIHGQPSHLPA